VNRVRQACETQFQRRLEELGARRLKAGVDWLLRSGERRARGSGRPVAAVWMDIETRLCQVVRRRSRTRTEGEEDIQPPRFLCDAGLGGLARWLRAAGYDARWEPEIEDSALLLQAMASRSIVVTTDSFLLDRRLVTRGEVLVLWLPPVSRPADQLGTVLRRLGLSLRPPRCMACGGQLEHRDKSAVVDRVPPRTARWLEAYFTCRQCGQLFWHGTHWLQIALRLEEVRQ
jgi:hypothetical protein